MSPGMDFPHTVTNDSDNYIVIARPPTFTSDELPPTMDGFESVAVAADVAMDEVLTEDWLNEFELASS